jgi:hypothetical protein
VTSLNAPEDPDHEEQRRRGEREHHERLEQLQLGDLNVETSIEMSKQGSNEPFSTVEPEEPDRPDVEKRNVEGEEDRMPRILTSPNTQHRDL